MQHRHLPTRDRFRKTTSLPLPKGVNRLGGAKSAFTHDGSPPALLSQRPDSPNDVWTYSVADGKSQQIYEFAGSWGAFGRYGEPFLVHYPSRDGKWTISAFVYVPYNMARSGQNAAVVYVHGGPTSQSVNSFSRIIQHMVNQATWWSRPTIAGLLVMAKNFSRPTCSTWARRSAGCSRRCRFRQADGVTSIPRNWP